MRRLVGVAMVALAALGASQAFGGTGTKVAKVPLPAPGSASVRTFPVTVKSAKAVLPSLKVKVVDDKAFGNASAVAVIAAPRKASKRSVFHVSVLVRRFGTPDRRVATAADFVALQIITKYESGGTSTQDVGGSILAGCLALGAFDQAFEKGATMVNDFNQTLTLVSLRPLSMQDSPPEEVLDNVIELAGQEAHCTGDFEGDDPGPK